MKITIERIELDRIMAVPGLRGTLGVPARFTSPVASGMAVLAHGIDARSLGQRLVPDHPNSILHKPVEVSVGYEALDNPHAVPIVKEDFIAQQQNEFDYFVESSKVRVASTCEVFITVGDWVISSNRLRSSQLPEDGQALSFILRGLSLWVH
jgi:hypothetical protein